MGMLGRILPPTKLERDLAYQCVLSAFATGSFLTGTAVFFTQIVGLSGAQVGAGMSIAAGVTLLLQMPMGRLADRVGAKPLWVLASAVEAALYFAWPFIGGMAGFVGMLSVLAVFETASRNARNVYRIAVFPRAVRVRRWPTNAPHATSDTPSEPEPAGSRSALASTPYVSSRWSPAGCSCSMP